MKRLLAICTIFASASCFAQTGNISNQNNASWNNNSSDNSDWRSSGNVNGSNGPCITAPLTVSGTKEVTVGGNLPQMGTNKVFVYYHRRRAAKRPLAPGYADLTDRHASNPILLSKDIDAGAMQPQTYRVSLTTPDNRVKVCSDAALNLAANIDVQAEGEYTGNYPTTGTNTYKLVSKRTYKRTARKMRNAEWKERRVARLTGVPVKVSTSNSSTSM